MAEVKTKATKASAAAFLDAIQPEGKRKCALTLFDMKRMAHGGFKVIVSS